MEKGIIYCMSTIVDGLVKIGKTGTDNFEHRMYILEHNGYCNVAGLKREFAIEVDKYDEKEGIIHSIFEKSRVGNTELFSVDLQLVKQLLSSMEGKQVYPKGITKNEVFDEATQARNIECIPDGDYFFETKPKRQDKVYKATLRKVGNKLILLKGSDIVDRNNTSVTKWSKIKEDLKIKDEKLLKDIQCDSPSMAATLVSGTHVDGWLIWKTQQGQTIDIYRKNDKD